MGGGGGGGGGGGSSDPIGRRGGGGGTKKANLNTMQLAEFMHQGINIGGPCPPVRILGGPVAPPPPPPPPPPCFYSTIIAEMVMGRLTPCPGINVML